MASRFGFAALIVVSGCTGEGGPVGPEGPTGEPGTTGELGPAGAEGERGPIGPAGADGSDGADGLNCWDLNADGECNLATEDIDTDGTCDANDCRGADGAPGIPGPEGPTGPAGPAGPTAAASCRSVSGRLGFLRDGVCVIQYRNSSAYQWNDAVAACAGLGGDLCSTAQYATLAQGSETSRLFYPNRPVWTNDFSDNDSSAKTFAIASSDDPATSQQYGYACCSRWTPEPYRANVTNYGGVRVTYTQTDEDTTFRAAAQTCHSLGSELCTKSQYVVLNDAGVFDAAVARWTNEMSDNDVENFAAIVGTNAPDNPTETDLGAFACCTMNQAPDGSCFRGTLSTSGVCLAGTRPPATFFDAARECASLNADLCTNSQLQALRNVGDFEATAEAWTASGADNDSTGVGGLLATQPDNPNPAGDSFAYACCF